MSSYVLALDEGSTSARAVLVGHDGTIVAEQRNPLVTQRPHPGWVEFDSNALWEGQLNAIAKVLADTGASFDDVVAIGITTHRESCLIWDRQSGRPVHHALMWMSQQSDDIVRRWSSLGLDEEFARRTGLRNDSFFSAAKLAWLLENVPGVREGAERGDLVAGTVDSWLLWKLTGGRSHLTDHSEASRTALFSLDGLDWDKALCATLDIPVSLLPPAVPSDSDFGVARPQDLGLPGTREVPIRAVMGDQQAAMFGQRCLDDGTVKNTFGTAGVLTANTGSKPRLVDGLTASVCWTIGSQTAYEIEGVVFHSGQTLQWLRDNLGVLRHGERIDEVASSTPDTGGVYFVPAFAGMCAPHWRRDARAALVGMTLDTGREHVVRAAMEAMAYQNCDNVMALREAGFNIDALRVDGGGSASDLLCQFQADVLGIPVIRPRQLERTALGVAQVAGLAANWWRPQDVAAQWKVDRTFEPSMSQSQREQQYAGWCAAVESVVAR